METQMRKINGETLRQKERKKEKRTNSLQQGVRKQITENLYFKKITVYRGLD